MNYFLYVLAFLILLPFHVFAQDRQGTISGSDAAKYRSFLKEQRGSEKSGVGNIQDYRDDRNTKVRKLSESIQYEEKEAKIAKEQARDERAKEREDLKISRDKKINELVDKGASAKTDKEADRYYKGARQLKEPSKKSKSDADVRYK
ncbi:MAG: hypothetical protein NTX36_09680 [Proteobacteria bacterium]|nr:hypothetical protein [Pseudomonadota bacterium]